MLSCCYYFGDISYVSAISKNNIFVQFHPEKPIQWLQVTIQLSRINYAYKRLIFTLHYDSGSFCLSRNFRLHRVGDINWLVKNYDLKALCSALDELVILNVSKQSFSDKYNSSFFSAIDQILSSCYCPVSIGGGRSVDHAKILMSSGADKVTLCSLLSHDIQLARQISDIYGSQLCLVGAINLTLG